MSLNMEESAIKALIEVQGKRPVSKIDHVTILRRTVSSIGKPPAKPLSNVQRTHIKRHSRESFVKSSRDQTESPLLPVPMVKLNFEYPKRQQERAIKTTRKSLRKRSNSSVENKENKDNKKNDPDLPVMRKMIQKLVQRNLRLKKNVKKKEKLYKVQSVHSTAFPKLFSNHNSNA
jgi:hypothetical protein